VTDHLPSVGPVGDLPGEIRYAALVAVHDAWPTDSQYIDDWHPDDQAMFRRQSWDSFAARSSAVLTERQQRIAAAVASSIVPLIRAHIADEIDAIPRRTDFQITCRDAHNAALAKAARVARGGTDGD
jgi:hypothetical protein